MSKSKTIDPLPDSEKLRKEVGRRLKTARSILRLTMKDVSEATGFSVANISRCESGERLVSAELAIALRIRLGISEQYLFHEEGSAIIGREIIASEENWTAFDALMEDLGDVVDRLQEWRSNTLGEAGEDTPRSNAKVVGSRRRAKAEDVAGELNRKKVRKNK